MTHRAEMIRSAFSYADADRSDPFVMARMLAHINSGICDDVPTPDGSYRPAHYKAEFVKNSAGEWKPVNMQRP